MGPAAARWQRCQRAGRAECPDGQQAHQSEPGGEHKQEERQDDCGAREVIRAIVWDDSPCVLPVHEQ